MTGRLTAQQEAALLAAEAKATKGPWFAEYHLVGDNQDETKSNIIADCGDRYQSEREQGWADADFIALAREGVPAMLAELTAVRAERDAIREAVLAIPLAADGALPLMDKVERVLRAVNAARDVACGVKR
jgi:hypothetical protein